MNPLKRYRYTLVALSIGIAVLIVVIPSSATIFPETPPPHPEQAQQFRGAIAQSATRDSGRRYSFYNAWRLVYEQLPDFPMENHYIGAESGEQAENNTLADRLIRYHIFVKNRAPNSRLDWKFTLADYLGVNETILAYQYPGSDSLETNPLPADMEVIGQLNRQQRNQLVDVMVSLFSQPTDDTGAMPDEPDSNQDNSNSPPAPSPPPVLTGPGAADLLQF
jgi:hypothetical protein